MKLLEKARENAEAVRNIGLIAIEEARRLGVPVHYMDPAVCDGIIRELPEGTRQHVRRVDGNEIVIEDLPPRV
ncbi:hypothetical protein [Microvirga subterranea]|uniref:Uncharacterized protein n=1 Tax=Microvirga subterranea TaxID=186651 RepID=A0A370HA79_9HYPH|nr:hypothetical protein [Microvirga subterranea]RDI53852.1 hypothetical protein DES45_11256 [Microvirga subterranea]